MCNNFTKMSLPTIRGVIDELNRVADSGIKLVYIPGNHNMMQGDEVLQEAIPQIV